MRGLYAYLLILILSLNLSGLPSFMCCRLPLLVQVFGSPEFLSIFGYLSYSYILGGVSLSFPCDCVLISSSHCVAFGTHVRMILFFASLNFYFFVA